MTVLGWMCTLGVCVRVWFDSKVWEDFNNPSMNHHPHVMEFHIRNFLCLNLSTSGDGVAREKLGLPSFP